MNQIQLTQIEQNFPNYGNSLIKPTIQLEFTFEQMQSFLNKNGYELQIKEQRSTQYHRDNDNNSTGGTYQSINKTLIAVPIGTELPDILPELSVMDANYYQYSYYKIFQSLLVNKLLSL